MKISVSKWLLPFLMLVMAALYFNYSKNNHYQKHKEMSAIQVGGKIPDFALHDQNGKLFEISSLIGKKKLIIYFYPKDNSPGCTREACYFRDQFDVFNNAGAAIIGISGQSVESHKKFAEKHKLTFTLLSDAGNKVRKMFGVPANALGLLPGRVTYVADQTGKVVYIFNSQRQAERHIDEALKILQGLI
jgi:thioredoxin-dependent peroxiredoxin